METACCLVSRSPSSVMEEKTPHEVWDLVELSVGRKPIERKWVFKKKMNVEGKVEK